MIQTCIQLYATIATLSWADRPRSTASAGAKKLEKHLVNPIQAQTCLCVVVPACEYAPGPNGPIGPMLYPTNLSILSTMPRSSQGTTDVAFSLESNDWIGSPIVSLDQITAVYQQGAHSASVWRSGDPTLKKNGRSFAGRHSDSRHHVCAGLQAAEFNLCSRLWCAHLCA